MIHTLRTTGGSNENTNGLLRDFFPKGTDLSIYTYEEIKYVEKLLNEHIRKMINWKTPDECFNALLNV